MKRLVRPPYQGPSGYVALMIFVLTFTAATALVIAPEHVKSALDSLWTWPFE